MKRLMLVLLIAVIAILEGCVSPQARVTEDGAVVIGEPIPQMVEKKQGDIEYTAVIDRTTIIEARTWEEFVEKLNEKPPSQRLLMIPRSENPIEYMRQRGFD